MKSYRFFNNKELFSDIFLMFPGIYLYILQIPQQQGALLRYFGQRLAAAGRVWGGAGAGLSWCVLAVQSWCVVRGRAPHLCPHVWHQRLRRWYFFFSRLASTVTSLVFSPLFIYF
jgi:hypothetical protein